MPLNSTEYNPLIRFIQYSPDLSGKMTKSNNDIKKNPINLTAENTEKAAKTTNQTFIPSASLPPLPPLPVFNKAPYPAFPNSMSNFPVTTENSVIANPSKKRELDKGKEEELGENSIEMQCKKTRVLSFDLSSLFEGRLNKRVYPSNVLISIYQARVPQTFSHSFPIFIAGNTIYLRLNIPKNSLEEKKITLFRKTPNLREEFTPLKLHKINEYNLVCIRMIRGKQTGGKFSYDITIDNDIIVKDLLLTRNLTTITSFRTGDKLPNGRGEFVTKMCWWESYKIYLQSGKTIASTENIALQEDVDQQIPQNPLFPTPISSPSISPSETSLAKQNQPAGNTPSIDQISKRLESIDDVLKLFLKSLELLDHRVNTLESLTAKMLLKQPEQP